MSTPDQPTRTFHTNDYRRTASLLQSFRHVRGDLHTPKDETSQAKVNALAALFASAFSQDAESAPGAPFSTAYFLAGTQLPPAPQASQDDGTEDGDVAVQVAQLLDSPDPWDAAASASGYDSTDTA